MRLDPIPMEISDSIVDATTRTRGPSRAGRYLGARGAQHAAVHRVRHCRRACHPVGRELDLHELRQRRPAPDSAACASATYRQAVARRGATTASPMASLRRSRHARSDPPKQATESANEKTARDTAVHVGSIRNAGLCTVGGRLRRRDQARRRRRIRNGRLSRSLSAAAGSQPQDAAGTNTRRPEWMLESSSPIDE